MTDRNGKTIYTGNNVTVDINGNRFSGVVVGFEQVGTIHENVIVANTQVGYISGNKRKANVWARQIIVKY